MWKATKYKNSYEGIVDVSFESVTTVRTTNHIVQFDQKYDWIELPYKAVGRWYADDNFEITDIIISPSYLKISDTNILSKIADKTNMDISDINNMIDECRCKAISKLPIKRVNELDQEGYEELQGHDYRLPINGRVIVRPCDNHAEQSVCDIKHNIFVYAQIRNLHINQLSVDITRDSKRNLSEEEISD